MDNLTLLRYLKTPQARQEFISKYGDDWICFDGADYISNLLGKYRKKVLYADGKHVLLCLRDFVQVNTGDYFVELNTPFESHHFIIRMDNQHVVIFNSYGGVDKFCAKKFLKLKWIDELSNSHPTVAEYANRWGLHENNIYTLNTHVNAQILDVTVEKIENTLL